MWKYTLHIECHLTQKNTICQKKIILDVQIMSRISMTCHPQNICVCVCVTCSMRIHIHHIHVEVTAQPQMSFLKCCWPCFMRQGLSLAWNSPWRAGWLAIKPQGSSRVPLPGTRIASLCYHAQLLCRSRNQTHNLIHAQQALYYPDYLHSSPKITLVDMKRVSVVSTLRQSAPCTVGDSIVIYWAMSFSLGLASQRLSL